jgi:cysteinyl-tRNA synthetase
VIYDVPKNYFNSNQSNPNLEKVPLDINSVPENIVELATERMKLKLSKQYSEADNIRKQLTTLGYDIKDSKDGYILYKI